MPEAVNLHRRVKRMGFEGNFWVGEHLGVWGEWQAQRGCRSSMPFPMPCPVLLFHLAVPQLYPFLKSWQSSKCKMVEFYELLQQINQTQEQVIQNLWSCPKFQVTTWTWGLASRKCGGGGQVLQDLALHLCDLMLNQGDSVRMEVLGYWETSLCCFTYTHMGVDAEPL